MLGGVADKERTRLCLESIDKYLNTRYA
ncbi:MAG TPA: hypothetical protein PK423_09945 [Clostridiales bacterium]|nr:hypothetical protein [Clostridiales bacterium]